MDGAPSRVRLMALPSSLALLLGPILFAVVAIAFGALIPLNGLLYDFTIRTINREPEGFVLIVDVKAPREAT